MGKLWPIRDSVEYWRRSWDLINDELSSGTPSIDPRSAELTRKLRDMIEAEWVPPNIDYIGSAASPGREEKVSEIMMQICDVYREEARLLVQTMRQLSPTERTRALREFVCSQTDIKQVIGFANIPAGMREQIAESWVILDSVKAARALALECAEFSVQTLKKKNFVNRIHDLDYAMSLRFAHGIASNETRGALRKYCSWMYDDGSKIFLNSTDISTSV